MVNADGQRVTVRTGRAYPVDFTVDLGQRDVRLVKGRQAPLRFVKGFDAVGLVEPGADLIHAWNTVPVATRRPFVVTFEDYLPRTPEDRPAPRVERWLRRRLVSPQCKRIIALSDYARRQFLHQHRDDDRLDELRQRLEVLYPAVRPRGVPPRRAPRDRLRLLGVGKDFMRKGFPALVRAHERLRALGVPVETTVVSTLRWSEDDYIGPPSRAVYDDEVARLRSSGVQHHGGLPNARVLELMRQADLLVFPTLHDTFGFVAIEALAGGTPVVAAATCALPEVVQDGENGFLLPLRNDPVVGKWEWTYRNHEPEYVDAYRDAIAGFAAAIVARVGELWECRDERYEPMSEKALAVVEARFNATTAAARLEEVYRDCLRES